MIDKFQFDPVDGLQNASAYPDDPGNEEAFREQLQRPLNQVKEYVNSLVDAYAKTEAGRSGAEEIGSEAITGLMDPSNPLQPALTVRKQLQAAQKNIDDIIAGIIPDGSVNTEKIADGAVTPDKVSGGVGCNYIRNRIPTTGDNFNLGYKVGDTWTVPDMTLNNLIPHATAITPADWTLQNGSLAGSGSEGTITCGNGLESATAKISIAPIPGHVYALFGALKVTSANVITSISLGADQKAAPVKDAAYNLCEIITAPAEFKIQIIAASAAAINGTTVEFDKVCIVDMTADMVGVPFDRAGAIEYFSSHAAFISQEPDYAGMNWYCKGSGVWQSSSQLSPETTVLYGVGNVDDALIEIGGSVFKAKSFLSGGSWGVPAGVTKIKVFACASGAGVNAGEYILGEELTVTPNQTVNITVGSGNTIINGAGISRTLIAGGCATSVKNDIFGITLGIDGTKGNGSFGGVAGKGGAFGCGGGGGAQSAQSTGGGPGASPMNLPATPAPANTIGVNGIDGKKYTPFSALSKLLPNIGTASGSGGNHGNATTKAGDGGNGGGGALGGAGATPREFCGGGGGGAGGYGAGGGGGASSYGGANGQPTPGFVLILW